MTDGLSSGETTTAARVLIVDDDADVRQAASLLLSRRGYRAREAASAGEARGRLAEEAVDLVLLDLNLTRGESSGEEGLALLADILVQAPRAAVVVVTAHSGVNIAVKAMRAGAADFVTKPWGNARLLATLELALAGRRPADTDDATSESSALLGDSPVIARTRDLVRRIAPTEAAVLVTGPAGAGKSLLAQLIHRGSARAPGPLVALALAALEADAAEAALFGDPRGERPGALAEAKGGALVLDEIGALAAPVQARLLAALQAGGAPLPAGGSTLPVDVRPISLSRSVQALSRVGHDLLDRLATVQVAAPGLSGGVEDVHTLATHFLRQAARRHGRPERPLSTAALAWLSTAQWPQSVRSLRQAMERAVVLAAGPVIAVEDLLPPGEPAAPPGAPRLADSEKALLTAALKRHGFNVSRAAAELGLTRPALYRRMARHGL